MMTEPEYVEEVTEPETVEPKEIESEKIESYVDPATGMTFMSMSSWPVVGMEPTPEQIKSAERLEGKVWEEEKKLIAEAP